MLFFDEADALFGKRSRGLATPTTATPTSRSPTCCSASRATTAWSSWPPTCAKNLDDAFLRRLQSASSSRCPTPRTARRIWQPNLPADSAARPTLDLDVLATQFELSGGSIRNAAVAGRVPAAAAGGSIGMDHLVQGVLGELRKVGRIVKPAELGGFAHLV